MKEVKKAEKGQKEVWGERREWRNNKGRRDGEVEKRMMTPKESD
jgi:hypothetical protein